MSACPKTSSPAARRATRPSASRHVTPPTGCLDNKGERTSVTHAFSCPEANSPFQPIPASKPDSHSTVRPPDAHYTIAFCRSLTQRYPLPIIPHWKNQQRIQPSKALPCLSTNPLLPRRTQPLGDRASHVSALARSQTQSLCLLVPQTRPLDSASRRRPVLIARARPAPANMTTTWTTQGTGNESGDVHGAGPSEPARKAQVGATARVVAELSAVRCPKAPRRHRAPSTRCRAVLRSWQGAQRGRQVFTRAWTRQSPRQIPSLAPLRCLHPSPPMPPQLSSALHPQATTGSHLHRLYHSAPSITLPVIYMLQDRLG